MEEKIYLVIIDIYKDEENSIVNICTSREKAEELMERYKEQAGSAFNYHIDEVVIDFSKDILWDCYDNNILRK